MRASMCASMRATGEHRGALTPIRASCYIRAIHL
jgi:hypothetical protein